MFRAIKQNDLFRSVTTSLCLKIRVLISVFTLVLCLSGIEASAARPGSADTSFGSGGVVGFSLANSAADGDRDLVIQPDGKIVIVSQVRLTNTFNGGVITLARCNRDGTPDTSFGNGGVVTTDISTRLDYANSVALQSDGKIVIAGVFWRNVGGKGFIQDIHIVRYNANGSLDSGFDGDGIVTATDIGENSWITDIGVQPDGKILISGSNGNSFLLMRYNADGARDMTFDGDGIAQDTAVGGVRAGSMIQQPDGKIVLSGATHTNAVLARYLPNGALDTIFGAGGVVNPALGISMNFPSSALQADGKIVLIGDGRITNPNAVEMVMLRFNSNGTFDSTFDGDGIVTFNIAGAISENGLDVAIQHDGKIVVLAAIVANPTLYPILRYLPDGSLDTGFDGDGIAYPAPAPRASAIKLQPDGKLVTAGAFSPYVLTISRYHLLGGAPFDFDGDGKTDIGVFRASNGQWWLNRSFEGVYSIAFGSSSDKIVPADFTGDGKTDITFWRPSTGEWFVIRSEDGSFFSHPFGASGDIPAPADFDGDGKADEAIFRPSTAVWYILKSSGGVTIQQFGANGDAPVVADYDGDGKADIAIYRAASGDWWYQRSSDGNTRAFQFGLSTDKPVQGDYTGDGRADVAFWRPVNGNWFVMRSEDNSYYSFPFGASGDSPAPGDYDGDGLFDATVFRPSEATWYVRKSTSGYLIQQFGASGDQPVANAFVP
jgi:uncharacterized delta-60 repeat protein